MTRLFWIWRDLEEHEVVQRCAPRLLELGEEILGRAHHAEVEVLGRAGSLNPKLEHELPLERRRLSEDAIDAREKAIK